MKITIGTRKSKLALVQTHWVRDTLLAAHPGLEIAIEHITTKGDAILDRPLSAIGDKGLFVTEIEDALRAGRVDLAVHSAKDLPSVLPDDMTIAAYPRRADPRDVLVAGAGKTLADLPPGARVGTSSPRRACQLRHLRPDLELLDIRGNVDTRLRKLDEGQYEAIVLAAAGLERLDLLDRVTQFFDPAQMLPAVSQGTLGVEIRLGDTRTAELLQVLDDPAARITATAEKAFLAHIGGGCQVAVGAFGQIQGATLTISGMIGALDGRQVRDELSGPATAPTALGAALAAELLAQGGAALLKEH
ncbi:MAG: hydroxymethylbilane synthase [Herpetosiphonaceae bacterium]|nr:hydroxymethylbilane synthase [Herpetosiphonaceae bacterium]